MLSLILLILSLIINNYQVYAFNAGIITLWIAMFLTVVSGYKYYREVYN